MSFTSRYNAEHDVVVQVIRGVVTLELAQAVKREEMARGEHGPGSVWLIDLREARIDPELVGAWMDWVRTEYPELRNPGAVVANDPPHGRPRLGHRPRLRRAGTSRPGVRPGRGRRSLARP